MQALARNLSVSAAVLGLSVVAADAANAANLTRNFQVNVESGNLSGQIFSGSVTFDESLLDSETVVLNPGQFSLKFDFLGTIFTETDDFFSFATAEITQYGNVLGLGYTVDSFAEPNAFFSFIPTDSSIGDRFTYDQFDIAGVVIDSGEGQLEAVPESGVTVALGVLGLLSLVGFKTCQAA